MASHQLSRVLPYPCRPLFDLVLDIERYPEFVPGYAAARVLRREDATLTVEQHIGLGPASFRFRSRADFLAHEHIFIRALDGPFRRFEVSWRFVSQEGGCRVTVETLYQPNRLLAPLLHGVMDAFGARLLDAFARRAAQCA